MIYLDNAATTYHKPESVIQAVADAMRGMGNSGRGAYPLSLDASRMIYKTRCLAAEFFGMEDPRGVAFTWNATSALNMVIQGLFSPGDHIITTMMEHNSVLRPLYFMENKGVELTVIPVSENGIINYEDFEDAIKDNTKAIICTHVSNLTGDMIDILQVGEICRKNQILFVLDASQSAGIFDIHMKDMNIDILCFTGHKGLMGPQGTGGICMRNHISILPLIMGGSGIHSYSKTHPDTMPEALEAGTLNGHGIAGLYQAFLYLKEVGIENIREKELKLAGTFYQGVKEIEGVVLYGDFNVEQRGPVVALNIQNLDSSWVADELAVSYEIAVRSGAHCAPLMHHALGTVSQGAVRFSFSWFNTEEEVEKAVIAVRELSIG